jgi:hypothetical protein
MLQFLSEYLLETNKYFSINNLIEILKLINIPLDQINKNYLAENLNKYEIPDNIEFILLKNMIIEKQNQYTLITSELDEIDINLNKINNNTILTQKEKDILTEKVTINYSILTEKKNVLDNDILILNKYSTTMSIKIDFHVDDENIINRYNILEAHINSKPLLLYAWKKLLNEKIINNYNIIPIYLLEHQYKIINNNPIDLSELNKIKVTFKHIAQLCEKYFILPHYTDDNLILKFIKDMLVYITQIIIGSNIELIIRRLLFTYLLNTLGNKDLKFINDTIECILTNKLELLNYNNYNLLDYLYKIICSKLVNNCSEIYKNEIEKESHNIESVCEILSSYFDLFNLSTFPEDESSSCTLGAKAAYIIPKEILQMFKESTIQYFDIFIANAITLWHVNAENILKYFINNYRCLETLCIIIENNK